jgi:hypothetical protein
MIAVDTNLLVYAHREDSSWHDAALAKISPWPCMSFRMDGEFPKNLKHLWNHPDLSQKTKEKIAYHNGKAYFQLDRPVSAHAGRKAN